MTPARIQLSILALALLPLMISRDARAQSAVSNGGGAGTAMRWADYIGSAPDRTAPAMAKFDADNLAQQRTQAATGDKVDATQNTQIGQVLTRGLSAAQALGTLRELLNAYRALNAADDSLMPALALPGAPQLPVSCTQEGCSACYTEAHGALRDAVLTLERLRAIYGNSKNVSTRAIAFGDSASGIHAVVGLAWQKEKRGIQDAVKGLEAAYDRKKPQLMDALKAALDKISTCEQKFYDNADWYNRFGFIYFQFMDAKYTRS